MQRIVAHHRSGGTVVSVCAGADALGRMGLLDGRRCTTHHELQDELAQRYPKAKVVRDVLFVDDDRVFSSAGIASGIDLALHIVAQRHGPAFAARVARTMVVYTRRNGDQAQQSAMLQHRIHLIDVVHRVQDVIDARFKEPLSAAELAQAQGSTCGRSDEVSKPQLACHHCSTSKACAWNTHATFSEADPPWRLRQTPLDSATPGCCAA
jgi:transcriptional regulator GlxA family with amidase domain